MPRTAARVVYNKFPEIAAALPVAAGRIVRETVFAIEGRAKQEMAAAKSGRRYGSHVASAPGEAPAVDLGALINSIQTAMDGTKGQVYTNMLYAVYLEFGTRKMAPRPFFTPAAEESRGNFVRKMRDLGKRIKV
jgi:HK97 gp10 family phage protein